MIKTLDGVLTEIEGEPGGYEPCSARSAGEVKKRLEQIEPLLRDVCANDIFRSSWLEAGVERKAFAPPPPMKPAAFRPLAAPTWKPWSKPSPTASSTPWQNADPRPLLLGKSHNQGYFTSGFDAAPTLDEVIFYKNGYKTDPMVDPDPRRTIFDRNIYQGGGAQMGHTYRNIISADGGSGGPQMRLGGLIENSLIIEGYWFSATGSNKPVNSWMTSSGQQGRSAMVRNNVQFIFKYPSPNDPDTNASSDNRAQPAHGYSAGGVTFGAMCEDNIVHGAMLADDLGFPEHRHGYGFAFTCKHTEYEDGRYYAQRNNVFRGDIAYRTAARIACD